ncbi:MAG: chromosomal replication initiator protein DnaA [Bacteroidetes bacterium]|jgi:chromosomal replication initiator protein|nr:chromosomal replication initiator protein DnaA [Bacteroidota bacterium]
MDRSPESVWNECLDIIRDNISRQSYKTWFEPLKAIDLDEEDDLVKLTIQLPSRFYYEWLEEHYFSLLRKTVTKVIGPRGRLFYDIVIEKDDDVEQGGGASMHLPARQPANEPPSQPSASPGDAPASSQPSAPPASSDSAPDPPGRGTGSSAPAPQSGGGSPQGARASGGPRSGSGQPAEQSTETEEAPVQNPFAIPGIQKAEIDSQLNDGYTFERFIEGDCNRLARSAAWAIAQEPGGTSFNPFLVYGGVGLGKTHLIHAIGNYARVNSNAESVLYVSSERFTTEFVQSIQRNRISEFSMFYRQIDLLIVDDVQFFSGKEKTQEEFFHIFNALHQSGKQIVLSADRPPREIQGIEERLLSRFQWGLSADVQPPGLETRIAILQRKAEDDGIELPQEVIEFIAHNVKSNIRELEGALIRLLAHSTLHQRDIDIDLAKEVLRDLMQDSKVNLTIEEIQRIVCDYLDIPEDLVRAKTRKREVVRARQIAMYFSKDLTQHSLKTIGLHFGGRDHSTVIHANKTVEDQIETDDQFRSMVEEIGRKIELRAR